MRKVINTTVKVIVWSIVITLIALTLSMMRMRPAGALSMVAPTSLHKGWSVSPITISNHGVLIKAAGIWNTLAGKALFTVAREGEQPMVRGYTSTRGYSYAYVHGTDGVPSGCDLYYHDDGVYAYRYMVHELGHCLGYADHIHEGEHYHVNNKHAYCDGEHATGYFGIMSYCTKGYAPSINDLAAVGDPSSPTYWYLMQCINRHMDDDPWVCLEQRAPVFYPSFGK